MGKFRFSKKAYLKKIKEKRDWEEGSKDAEKERPDVNKTMRCYRFVGLDGQRGVTITVEIKAGKCDSSYRCSSVCKFR